LDEREVETSRERKSIGAETTFGSDILDIASLVENLRLFSHRLTEYATKRGFCARTITVKVKYHDFKRITRSKTLDKATSDNELILRTAKDLLGATEAGKKKIRLIGLSLSSLMASG
jgi:DNA polymerase-4